MDLGLARFVCIIALRKCDGPDESRYQYLLARFARPLCLDIFSSSRDLLKVPGVVPRVHGALRPVAPVPSRECRAPCSRSHASPDLTRSSPIQQRTRKQTWLCTPMWLCDPSCGILCLIVPTIRVRADLCRLVLLHVARRWSKTFHRTPHCRRSTSLKRGPL